MESTMHRRSFLRLALAGTAGVALSACGETEPSEAEPTVKPAGTEVARRSVLLAYFSRAGENYYYGGRRNLTVGNTEMFARTIRTRIVCDVHRIEAAKPYSRDYDETVARNVREQVADPYGPASPTRSPRSSATTRSCWPARSGTCERQCSWRPSPSATTSWARPSSRS